MASRFWVGGTGTWDAADTTHWSATSGGAGGQSVPVTADAVTFDASSGGGTVTVATNFTIASLTFTNYTGVWDNTVNNNSPTIVGVLTVTQASGGATISFGSGTYTMSASNSSVSFATVTSVTINAASATFSFTHVTPTAIRFITLNAQTVGGVTVAGVTSSAQGFFTITPNSGGTIGTLTIAGPNRVQLAGAQTLIVSNAFNLNSGGSASALLMIETSSSTSSATISVASGSPTFNWATLANIVGTGGGTFSAVNSFSIQGNTGISFSAPGGGGVVGVIGS